MLITGPLIADPAVSARDLPRAAGLPQIRHSAMLSEAMSVT